ncbi:MAG: YggS family pyridoxal phosphate-dependent enzyme [Firmicutes bacterium]|nr:YggS family pyridoxal phosphate-dependent enzyme [Bacillota bacterium]
MSAVENLRRVREAIGRAAARAGRRADEVGLVAVTKGVPVEVIREVVAAGQTVLGENRAQELVAKHARVPGAEWHFVGSLQTNKVRAVIDKVALVHSLDRWNLAVELDRRAQARGTVVPVLIQVNVSGEAAKRGVAPEELRAFARRVAGLPGLAVRGLMTIAPLVRDPEEVRPLFQHLRDLARRLEEEVPGVEMKYLSMGMSNDFEVAVEEGSTLVRVGTAIFGRK